MGKRKTPIRHAEIVDRFSAKLRELRSGRGLTQAQLAEKVNTTTSYIGRLESGSVAPGIDTLERLASALAATTHELIPTEAAPDTSEILRERAQELFEKLLKSADRETLSMLVPLLARLGESPTRRR